jgi:hypothetical protein
METYGKFPTLEEIKKDYNEIYNIIKNVNSVEQAQKLQTTHKLTVEINGNFIDEFLKCGGKNSDIEWIRVEAWGCLSYIYKWSDGKIFFDVWSDFCDYEFIENMTIDQLTRELYKQAKMEAIKRYE